MNKEDNATAAVMNSCLRLMSGLLMKEDIGSPKDANPKELWAHLKIRYKDGDKMVDEDGLIWDVWNKEGGYALYCFETKEAIEVPRPKKYGGG
tara:strand:+ start:15685 stop:15963 length:279 start_codon:yes stop_codon:yes gene_type:complete